MKKLNIFILVSFMVLSIFSTSAQVKVGTNPTTINTSAILDVESTNKGFLPPRMTTAERDAIASPAKGLVVYNITLDCLQVNKGTAASPSWECIGASAAATASADCNLSGFNGTYVSGTAFTSANTFTVTVNNLSFSAITVTPSAADLVLSGLTITSQTITPGAAVTIPSTGTGTLTYTISGTATSCGTLTGVWTKVGLTCTKIISVSPNNFLLPTTGITYNTLGEVSGFTANWTAQSGATGYTLERATSPTGPWTAFSSNPYTGTSAVISGLSGNYAYWVRVTLVGGSCDGATAISNGPAAGCAAKIDATTWKVFLCHNLGANPTLDPHTPVVGLQGAYIIWGRRGPDITGDSRVDWQSAPNNGGLGFVAAPTAANSNAGSVGSWTGASGNGAWLPDSKSVFDPCPTGYRVPSVSIMNNVIANNTITRTGTFVAGNTSYESAIHFSQSIGGAKNLTFTVNGYREGLSTNGLLQNRGGSGHYWLGDNDGGFFITSTTVNAATTGNRIDGYSVRCIKE